MSVAPAARADTWCVSPAGGCDTSHTKTTVKDGLDSAAANSGPDTVQLGATTYSENDLNYLNSSGGTVDVVGAGRSATILQERNLANSTTVISSSSGEGAMRLAHLGVRITGAVNVTGIRLEQAGDSVDDVAVDTSGSPSGPHGIRTTVPVTITNTFVSAPGSGGSCLDLGADATVSDVQLENCGGGLHVTAGRVSAQRLQVRNSLSLGIWADTGTTVIVDDSLIDSPLAGDGVAAFARASGGQAFLILRHVTITGTGDATGLEADAGGGGTSSVSARDSIVRVVRKSVLHNLLGTGTANVDTDYTDIDAGAGKVGGNGGSYTPGAHDVNVDPGFASATDWHISPLSPVVDLDPRPLAADEPTTDLDGGPRVINGSRDLGAYEAPQAPQTPTAQTAPTPQTTTGPTGTTARASISGFSVSPARFAVGPRPTALSALRRAKSTPRGTTFSYRLAGTASGTVMIRIERRLRGRISGRRCVAERRSLRQKAHCVRYVRKGTLTRRVNAGLNRTRFSGRLGRRALKLGRYRATITAAASGATRASLVHSTSFSVVSG